MAKYIVFNGINELFVTAKRIEHYDDGSFSFDNKKGEQIAYFAPGFSFGRIEKEKLEVTTRSDYKTNQETLKSVMENSQKWVDEINVVDPDVIKAIKGRIVKRDKQGSKALSNCFVEVQKAKEDFEKAFMEDQIRTAERKEKIFTESEVMKLQSKVFSLTGPGEVMMMFNELLGISGS